MTKILKCFTQQANFQAIKDDRMPPTGYAYNYCWILNF